MEDKKKKEIRLLNVEEFNNNMETLEKSMDYVTKILNKLTKNSGIVYQEDLEDCISILNDIRDYANQTINNGDFADISLIFLESKLK